MKSKTQLNGVDEAVVALQKDFYRGHEPKILYLDLEISPLVTLTFRAYQADAFSVVEESKIMAAAWQWEGEDQIHGIILPDFANYKPGLFELDDALLCDQLYDVMDKAEMIVGHNVKSFDIRRARTRFFIHHKPPTRTWKLEDTLFMARKYFAFAKNNLDYLSELDGGLPKTEKTYADLIKGCVKGETEKWELMREYNKRDIQLTRERYKRLAPWHETHYNLNLIRRKGISCPRCGSTDFRLDGHREYATYIRQRYQCSKNDCGKHWTGEIVASYREGTTELINQTNP